MRVSKNKTKQKTPFWVNYPFKIENHQPFFMLFLLISILNSLKNWLKIHWIIYKTNCDWLFNYIKLLKWNQLEKKGEQEKQAYQYQYKAAFGVTMLT